MARTRLTKMDQPLRMYVSNASGEFVRVAPEEISIDDALSWQDHVLEPPLLEFFI